MVEAYNDKRVDLVSAILADGVAQGMFEMDNVKATARAVAVLRPSTTITRRLHQGMSPRRVPVADHCIDRHHLIHEGARSSDTQAFWSCCACPGDVSRGDLDAQANCGRPPRFVRSSPVASTAVLKQGSRRLRHTL